MRHDNLKVCNNTQDVNLAAAYSESPSPSLKGSFTNLGAESALGSRGNKENEGGRKHSKAGSENRYLEKQNQVLLGEPTSLARPSSSVSSSHGNRGFVLVSAMRSPDLAPGPMQANRSKDDDLQDYAVNFQQGFLRRQSLLIDVWQWLHPEKLVARKAEGKTQEIMMHLRVEIMMEVLMHLKVEMEECEVFACVAFGRARTLALPLR